MSLRFNKLIKYTIILIIIYTIVSKLPLDNLPSKNPYIISIGLFFIIFLLDQPHVLFENFLGTQNETNSTAPVIVRPAPIPGVPINASSTSNELKNVIREALEEIVSKGTILKQSTNTSGLPSEKEIIKETIDENKDKADNCDCEVVAEKAVNKFLKDRRLIDKNGLLHYADDYIGDMGYSQIRLDNYIPLGASGNGVYDKWELGKYNFLNTERWKPSGVNTKQCRTENIIEPQPIDSKMPLNLLNWDTSRKIMPADQININYINDKLNH